MFAFLIRKNRPSDNTHAVPLVLGMRRMHIKGAYFVYLLETLEKHPKYEA